MTGVGTVLLSVIKHMHYYMFLKAERIYSLILGRVFCRGNVWFAGEEQRLTYLRRRCSSTRGRLALGQGGG